MRAIIVRSNEEAMALLQPVVSRLRDAFPDANMRVIKDRGDL